MKKLILCTLPLIILLNTNIAFSQEWKNLRQYRKENGNSVLTNGCWLKKDRKRQTEVWKQANMFNLSKKNGNRKYKTIRQIRDFYLFFEEERKKQGHEIKWMGIAAVAASQLSKLENPFIRIFIVRNREVVKFAHEGSENVLAFAFPQLREMYFSSEIIKGEDAVEWDKKYGMAEQCEILEPLYKQLSPKALRKIERMAKGKGIYNLGVPKRLKYVGKIDDCISRYEHGKNKLLPFCEDGQ